MKFHSELKIKQSSIKIFYKNKILFIGSCFSDNISNVLQKRKFSVVSNPFGIIYNPISICNNLDLIVKNRNITDKAIFFYNNVWKSFLFHSEMNKSNKSEYIENVNSKLAKTNEFLKETNHLFITFGTAWVYEKDNNVVANCHKITNNKFSKRLLSVNEIVDKAIEIFTKLIENNQKLNIHITISPVRHLKDGFVENNQSKAVLHLAVKELCEKFKNVNYFPSYEFVIDELRDYRFYKEDFVHPNSLAIKYIMQKFDEHYFDNRTLNLIKKIEKINSSLNHKVLNPNSEEYLIFKEKLHLQIKEFEEEKFRCS